MQWGGAQFYALTERGLYGSRDGRDWKPLYGALEAITTDPLHPQVAYASVTLDTQSSNEENDLDTTSPMTSTVIRVSVNDGRDWQDVDSIEGHVVTHLVRDPGDQYRIFALVTDGGLYRGTVRLPWLMREAVSWWLVGIISLLAFVAAPYGYFNLLQTYTLPSHRLTWGLLTRFWLLWQIRSQRFQNLLKPMAKLILATMDQTQFSLVEAWEKLDEIGVSTSRSRLVSALNDLAGYGLLKEQDDGSFRYTTPGLQNVAAVEFQQSEDALIEDVRRENRLLRDIERFFGEAGFDVWPGAPHHFTKFILRPRRSLYRDYDRLHAWLWIQKPLRTIDVDTICQEAIQEHTASTPGDDSATHPVPVAFFVVTELPKVEAFRKMRIWQEQVRMIPLSTTTIHSALREHSAIRDLDMLVQQERSQTNLYDIRAPIIDRMDFFGRQDKIDTLEKELREERSVDVWGLPGIGKSSLLWHLKDALVNPVAAYVDLEYGWQGETLFHEQIITDLANDLLLKYSRFLNEETGDFEKQLLSIAQAVPAGEDHDVQIVLLLDGVSVVTGDSAQWRTLEHLRHLADNHPNLAIVMTWQDSEVTVDAWKPLGTLDEKNSQQLITTIGAQMGLDFTQGSLVNIHRETGGHPFLLRQLGSAIAQQSPARAPTKFVQVTPVWVDRALSHYRLTRDYYFEDIWQWCSPNQKESLRAWSAMTGKEQELLLSSNPYLRALMQSYETLSDLVIAWILEATEENRL